MAGVYSRTAQCGMKVMFAAMRILQEEGGSCRLSDLRSRLAECLDFSSWEKEVVNGSVRWHNFLSWFSSCYVAAGFIRKQRGTWYLTDEGVACLSSSESVAFDKANDAYKEGSGGSAPASSGDVLEFIRRTRSDGSSQTFISTLLHFAKSERGFTARQDITR